VSALCIEPGSRLFRIKDASGAHHQLSAYLLREALTGDGICFPEDLEEMESTPEVVDLWPWDQAGGVRDFALAGTYLGLLRKRFSPMFRRLEWRFVLSPLLLEQQKQVWSALLRESAIRRFELVSNLDCLSWRRTEDGPGLFLHWGAGGGDLGICLQGETYRYQRLLVGEDGIVLQLRDWLLEQTGHPVRRDEAYRLLRLASAEGLAFPGGRLVEIGLGEGATPMRSSLEQEVLLQAILTFLHPQLEAVEEFVRGLCAQDQAELFGHGLLLSGGGVTLRLLRECLEEAFEFPVTLLDGPETAVLSSCKLR
jgi:hypothetical protein